MKIALLIPFLITAVCVFGQPYMPDRYGHIDDPKFLQLIKNRGYQLVGKMDTIRAGKHEIPLLLVAHVWRNDSLLFLDWNGVEYASENLLRKKLGLSPKYIPTETEIVTIVDGTPENAVFLDDDSDKLPVSTSPKTEGKTGYYKGNELVIPEIYDDVVLVSDHAGRRWLKAIKGKTEGIFSEDGKVIVPMGKQHISTLFEGTPAFTFLVHKKGKYGVLSENGKVTVPVRFLKLSWDNRDKILLFTENPGTMPKWGVVDSTGRIIVAPIYQSITRPLKGNLLKVTTFSRISSYAKFGLIDWNGTFVIDTICTSDERYTKDLLIVKRLENNKTYSGIVHTKTGELVLPMAYEIDPIYRTGFAAVYNINAPENPENKSHLTGLLDSNGRIVLEIKFQYLQYIRDNQLVVCQFEGKSGVMTLSGDTIVPFIYESLDSPKSIHHTRNNYAANLLVFKQNGQYGVMTMASEVLIPARYDYITLDNSGILCRTQTTLTVLRLDGTVLLKEQEFTNNDLKIKEGIVEYRTPEFKRIRLDLYGNRYLK